MNLIRYSTVATIHNMTNTMEVNGIILTILIILLAIMIVLVAVGVYVYIKNFNEW